jgi:outer membrane protein insertion porin family
MKMWWMALALSAAALAQTAPKRAPAKKSADTKPAAAAPSSWPIESLAVEGNRNYTRDQILAVAGLKIGQMAGKAQFEAARDRLIASGVFETVGYRFVPGAAGQGFAASFQVTEVQPAYPLRFEELGIPAEEIEAALRARDPLYSPGKLPATKPVIDRYTAWIADLLRARGIAEPVAAKVTTTGPDEFAIVFRSARRLPAVAEVSFEGNQAVPQVALREAVHATAIGFPYSEKGFRELLSTVLRPVYEQRGRVRVSFPAIRAEPVRDVEGVHVFVKIDEGASYQLGKVTVAPPSPVDPASLLRAGDFRTGDVANFDRVNDGLDRIRRAVRRAGYLDVKVAAGRSIDDERKTVDLAVHVDAGTQYTMGKLNITGLDLNGEAEILRIWTMKEGKPLNPEYPDAFLKRIQEQQLFEDLAKAKAELKVDEKKHTADVTLTFTGGDPNPPGGRGGRGGRGPGGDRP